MTQITRAIRTRVWFMISVLLVFYICSFSVPSPCRDKTPPSKQFDSEKEHVAKYLQMVKQMKDSPIPVLIMGCSRLSIGRAMDAVFKYRTSARKFPVTVSLDCGVKEVQDLVLQKIGSSERVWTTEFAPPNTNATDDETFKAYTAVARHYKWAIEKFFADPEAQHVIIIEDDFIVSPDFFSYFQETIPLMYMDPSLYCISSWNDQAHPHAISHDPKRLLRTDHMPGLGWLLTRSVYESIAPFPEYSVEGWDLWMRNNAQRRGRQCIIPEMSRNTNIGRRGVSNGYMFEEHVAGNTHTTFEHAVDFAELRETIAGLGNPFYKKRLFKSVYEEAILGVWNEVLKVPMVSAVVWGRMNGTCDSGLLKVRVEYESPEELSAIATALNIIDSVHDGVIRSAVDGILPVVFDRQVIAYFAPKQASRAFIVDEDGRFIQNN
ncbi:glycosyl transferase [Chytriomyces cf. hyalinus JEL632]|nr:glycosyl transferase [Chytriomyces cf. hyalinus JEL632]